MNLDGKPKMEIVVKASNEQEQKVSRDLETIFNQFKLDAEYLEQKAISESDDPNARLASSGRKELLFPLLKNNGIETWEQLDAEANLIDDKKSKLPSLVRDAIIHLHMHCVITKAKEDGSVK